MLSYCLWGFFVTKREVARKAATNLGLPQNKFEKQMNEFFRVAADALIDGDEIWMAPFGRLYVRKYGGREGKERLWLKPSVAFNKVLRASPLEAPAFYADIMDSLLNED